MSSPLICTRPDEGATMRLTMRNNVVFPQPEEPAKTVMVPVSTLKLVSCTATTSAAERLGRGYVLVTDSYEVMQDVAVYRFNIQVCSRCYRLVLICRRVYPTPVEDDDRQPRSRRYLCRNARSAWRSPSKN